VFGSSPNVGMSFFKFHFTYFFVYVVLAQIILIEIVLVYYRNISKPILLKTSFNIYLFWAGRNYFYINVYISSVV
jgi:hypothetical protein